MWLPSVNQGNEGLGLGAGVLGYWETALSSHRSATNARLHTYTGVVIPGAGKGGGRAQPDEREFG